MRESTSKILERIKDRADEILDAVSEEGYPLVSSPSDLLKVMSIIEKINAIEGKADEVKPKEKKVTFLPPMPTKD